MSELQIACLALIQGITEFLPISSSAHLILLPLFTGWPDQGLLFDIALHVGSLIAVILYFRWDLTAMVQGIFDWRATALLGGQGRRLIALLVVGTVPVVLAGFALQSLGTDALRGPVVIGSTSLVFGLALYAADRWARQGREIREMSLNGALLIGFAQILALIPGTSRSGITITAARALGYRRDEAARFSMLLSIPVILAAGSLLARDLVRLGEAQIGIQALTGLILAFVSAWLAIALLMRWLRRASFTPFVIYRCGLGVGLLLYAFGA